VIWTILPGFLTLARGDFLQGNTGNPLVVIGCLLYARSSKKLNKLRQAAGLKGCLIQIRYAFSVRIWRGMHPYLTAQNEPSNLVSLRRYVVRLLMLGASLSPADFTSPIGYLGPPESTPYYPTGDLGGDRNVAFTTVMNCLEHLEANLHRDDDIRIALKIFELAQALSDLGLREYALDTCGFALGVLESPHIAEATKSRLHVASVLSLRAYILCDLKRSDEANDAANRAVKICKAHRKSQATPIPELARALLNYAVVLNSIGLREESAAVALEVLHELDESWPDAKDVSALCKFCLSTALIGVDDDMARSLAEETIKVTCTSSDANSQAMLAGALLAESKVLSTQGKNDTASAASAKAVMILRNMSTARPVFSLFLAHALDTHAHHLLGVNHKGESHSVRRDAVELWQTLKTTAGGAVARPLAWSLFELAKFRHKDNDRNTRREGLRLAEAAVDAFRQVVPLDAPGLGDALYLLAERMLELDLNREAVVYAEESVYYFREASSKDPKYKLDLIFSLSLASACLACTERAGDAFEYAKQAVEVQHGRIDVGDERYDAHLRKLLMDVVFRATEMDKQDEAIPWFSLLQKLQTPGELGGMHQFYHFSIN
jgi:tetratricopeptide (TPR) repeat protein